MKKKKKKRTHTHTHTENIYTKQLNTLQWLAGIPIPLLPSQALSRFSFVTDVLLIRICQHCTVWTQHQEHTHQCSHSCSLKQQGRSMCQQGKGHRLWPGHVTGTVREGKADKERDQTQRSSRRCTSLNKTTTKSTGTKQFFFSSWYLCSNPPPSHNWCICCFRCVFFICKSAKHLVYVCW